MIVAAAVAAVAGAVHILRRSRQHLVRRTFPHREERSFFSRYRFQRFDICREFVRP